VTRLFDPFTLRGVTLRNRVAVSPMCQYSARDGVASDWHLVHLGSRAVGGAGMVMVEATAVEARGRISPGCLGLWNDAQERALARVAAFVEAQGAVPAIQLAHAGRKASTGVPWEGGSPTHPGQGGGPIPAAAGGWPVVGPSPIPFGPGYPVPAELSEAEILALVEAFVVSARRAVAAGFRLIELHAAHGYLGHSFLSPLSNQRTDAYGGSFEGRTRFVLELASAARAALPEETPLCVRLSCTDWVEGGWTLGESIELSRRLAARGVDLVDCSSAGLVPSAQVKVGPGYQVPFARAVRAEAGVPTIAVGLITEPAQAEEIVGSGAADLVMLARAELRDPYWPIHAARALGQQAPVPPQYARGYA
jgi:2,4-dienoyl-CoA reductase-like NADH-dependent reductase (Old Yellow Enzyme family)